MKKLLLVFVLIQFTAIFGCVMNRINPGDQVTKTYDISEFTKLDASHAFEVDIKVGEKASLKITAGENIHPIINATVKGNTLILEMKKSVNNSGEIKAEITVKHLTDISASGACKVKVADVDAETFNLDVSGASRILAENFKSNSLMVDMSGASSGELIGEIKNLTADISGAVSLDAKSLKAESVVIDLSGASNAKVYASSSLIVDASGASNLTYYGNPGNVKKDLSGASNLNSK